jgi:uncharacterized protein YdhG (YjbR/CyaY superfamily)
VPWILSKVAKAAHRGYPKKDSMATYEVDYQVATYSGTLTLHDVDDDAEVDQVKAMARAKLRQKAGGSLPFGYEHFKPRRID